MSIPANLGFFDEDGDGEAASIASVTSGSVYSQDDVGNYDEGQSKEVEEGEGA